MDLDNSHTKKKRPQKRSSPKKTFMTNALDFEKRAAEMFGDGPVDPNALMDSASDWVAANPKMAIGALLGGGVFLGLFAGSRFGRALLLAVLAGAVRSYVFSDAPALSTRKA